MSLFSQLKEQMRARDSQNDSKETEKASDPEVKKGGLFGAIQLKPADDETSVPPPGFGTPVRAVPSLEEARAELDRIRAESGQSSGLFHREDFDEKDKTMDEPATTGQEGLSFNSVSLPPLFDDGAPAQTTFAPDSPEQNSNFDVETDEAPTAEALFYAPPQFGDNSGKSTGSQNSIFARRDAPIESTPFDRSDEQTVYVSDEQQIIVEQGAASAIESQQLDELQTPVSASTEGAAPALTGEASSADLSPEGMLLAQSADQAATAARPSNTTNMTPFQRLMAARAAQGGAPNSRPRAERSAPVTSTPSLPVIEAPVAELQEVETGEAEPLQLELPREAASQTEVPAVEAPSEQAPKTETPEPEALLSADGETANTEIEEDERETSVPIEMPESSLTQEAVDADLPPLNEADESDRDAEINSPELGSVESEVVEVLPDETEASVIESAVVIPEAQMPETPEMQMSEADSAEVPEADRAEIVAVSEQAVSPEIEKEGEAEIVPEEDSTATASQDDESFNDMSTPRNDEPQERPVLSLSERLARVPRAELDAAHAEAQALTPEILEAPSSKREFMPEIPESTRPTASLSFAERLAARNREPIGESSAAVVSPEPSVAPSAAPDLVVRESDEALSVLKNPEVPTSEAPTRSAPRSFSERLAARTGLDRHLQVPVEEPATTAQELANHNTELARINEGAELSEREMKNRVLFRQKHLIFDSVIGSLDQRALQNPARENVKPQIEKAVDGALREFNLKIEQADRNWLVDEFVRETTDLGALVPMLEDPSISKIVVTGANDVSVERLGRIERTGVSFRDDDHLLSLVRRIAELSGGRVDAKVPLLDRPLPDGGRIRAKVPPLAPQPTITIEKSTGNPFVVLKRQMEDKSRGDALPYAQLRERIQQRLLREFEGDAAALAGDQDKLRQQVEEMIGSVIAEEQVAVTRAERASLVMDLLNEIVGLGPIEPLLNDPDVDEVMVNGPYQIYVERKGKLELTSQRFRDNAHVMQVIDRIVAPLGRRVDEKSPMVDGRLRDGSRFNAIIPPLALSGPTMTIRKFARDPFTMSDLINFGTMTREAAQFLQAAVEGRLNIVVSGGTGSGKTTTLNVLSSFIPSTERIVTIEDAAELQMRQEHVIRMETRPPNIEGVGEVGIRDLVKNSLRMRPDRIVVGECRGGEALDMLQAMNTGHDGSLTTAHSNGPRDTCKRLETMVMMAGFDLPVRAIREQISMAVQLVVHQERMRDGKRRVTAITEIVGMEGDVLTLQDIFRFEHEGMDDDGRLLGSLQATGMRPKYFETMIDNGAQLSMDIFQPKPRDAPARSRMTERGAR